MRNRLSFFEDEAEDVRFLAWTTTPWTLPSNCALAVGEKDRLCEGENFQSIYFRTSISCFG